MHIGQLNVGNDYKKRKYLDLRLGLRKLYRDFKIKQTTIVFNFPGDFNTTLKKEPSDVAHKEDVTKVLADCRRWIISQNWELRVELNPHIRQPPKQNRVKQQIHICIYIYIYIYIHIYSSRTCRIWADIYNQRGRRLNSVIARISSYPVSPRRITVLVNFQAILLISSGENFANRDIFFTDDAAKKFFPTSKISAQEIRHQFFHIWSNLTIIRKLENHYHELKIYYRYNKLECFEPTEMLRQKDPKGFTVQTSRR